MILISFRDCVGPKTVRLEGLGQLKNTMIPLGIEHGIVRFVG
jgi:hypothetical protein